MARAAVITISSSRAREGGDDESGARLAEFAGGLGLDVEGRDLIPDDRDLIEQRLTGPDQEELETTHVHLWGEVRNARGDRRVARMVAPNGYALTVNGVIAMAEHLLEYAGGGGYFTPVQLMGADFSQRLAGCGPLESQATPFSSRRAKCHLSVHGRWPIAG